MKKLLLSWMCLCAFLLVKAETIDVGGDYANASTFYNSSVNTQAPFLPHYKYSASQTIYTAEELSGLEGNQITALKYKLYNENYYMFTYHHLVKIYITEIDGDVFLRDDENKVVWFDKGTLCYSENVVSDFEGTCWDDYEFNFQLTKPYVYHGKNIVITVVNELTNDLEMCEQSGGEFAFYCYYTPKVYHTYHYKSDDTPFDSNTSDALCTYDYPVMQLVTSPVSGDITKTETLHNKQIIYVENQHIKALFTQKVMKVQVFNSLGKEIYQSLGSTLDCRVEQTGIYIVKYQLESGKEIIYKIVV